MHEFVYTDTPTLDPQELEQLEQVAMRVARACGRLITDERPEHLGVAATKSSGVDIVTVMDRRSEELARRLITQDRPDDELMGEEGLADPGTTGVVWIVDPIDGTVNYLYGIPAACVSVAAAVGDPRRPGAWRPIAGAVYNPSLDELFHARIGGGAWLDTASDEIELRLGDGPADLATALVATGFGYRSDVRAWQGRVVADLLPRVRDIRRLGSAALDLCHVAAGRVDAYYETGLHPWDLAAGWLIAAEAGASVRGVDAYPSADLTVAAPPGLVSELKAIVDPGFLG